MTVMECVQELLELRECERLQLTIQQFHALEVARVILISLDPAQRALIDSLLSMADASRN